MSNRLILFLASVAALGASPTEGTSAGLRISVYATAGDVLRHLPDDAARSRVLEKLQPLRVSHLFLEGRRGDEYAPPAMLREARAFLSRRGIDCSGGIATVPGSAFGTRQDGGLGWLNWEAEPTRRDVAGFFTENAPLFDELIVDDFFCTGDISPLAESRRGDRSWSQYRRDLLVAAIDPLIVQPARAAHPAVRLILKFPQWYDRFQLFGYDPPRMAARFDRIWVGTEVRNPATRRMGFVQPTEGYINFRWLTEIAGEKVVGAWFDHIECTPQNFVDQAFQSVLAGAHELTLFRLGDVMEGHPGDALLASRLPDLVDLASRIRGQQRHGIPFYKPPGHDADENLYLMDYLAMAGIPILPRASYPTGSKAVILGVQAAADPSVLERVQEDLRRGATVVVTPAFVRKAGEAAARLAGVSVGTTPIASEATRTTWGRQSCPLDPPLEIDASVTAVRGQVLMQAETANGSVPLLTMRRESRGRVLGLNVRTFAEQDFRDADEWLLAPKPRGLAQLAQPAADELRRAILEPLGVEFQAPAGVALHAFERGRCLYSFRGQPVTVRLDGQTLRLSAHGWTWVETRTAGGMER